MSISTPYADVEQYRTGAVVTNDDDDEAIERDLIATSRAMETELGQFFNVDAAATTRLFRARWSDRLDLDYEGNCPGIATTAGLIVTVDTDADGSFSDETAWTIDTDFQLEPLQAAAGPEPSPYTRLVTPRWSSKRFVPGGLVQVTAVFGWLAVPEGITTACIELTAIKRMESPRSKNRFDEMGQTVGTSRRAQDVINELLMPYRKVSLF